MKRIVRGFHFRYWTSKTDHYAKSYPQKTQGCPSNYETQFISPLCTAKYPNYFRACGGLNKGFPSLQATKYSPQKSRLRRAKQRVFPSMYCKIFKNKTWKSLGFYTPQARKFSVYIPKLSEKHQDLARRRREKFWGQRRIQGEIHCFLPAAGAKILDDFLADRSKPLFIPPPLFQIWAGEGGDKQLDIP